MTPTIPKKQRTKLRKNAMEMTANLIGVSVREFHANSFRLKKEGFPTIDYYPKGGRAFLHDTREWINAGNVIELITKNFTK